MKCIQTFAFYDDNKRRLSIFARVLEKSMLEILIFTCSKYDHFSKKQAIELFENQIKEDCDCVIGRTYLIAILDNKPKKTLLSWCKRQFYQKIRRKETKVIEELIGPLRLVNKGDYRRKVIKLK